MVKKKYISKIKIKIRHYTLKYIKNKFGGVQLSQKKKRKRKNHFNLGKLEKNTWGLKQKNGE